MSKLRRAGALAHLAISARASWPLLSIAYLPSVVMFIFLFACAVLIWRARNSVFEILSTQFQSTVIINQLSELGRSLDLVNAIAQDSSAPPAVANSRRQAIELCRELLGKMQAMLESAPHLEDSEDPLVLLKSIAKDFEELVAATEAWQAPASGAGDRKNMMSMAARLRQHMESSFAELMASLESRHSEVSATREQSLETLKFFQRLFIGCSVLFVGAMLVTGRSVARFIQGERVQAALQQSLVETANQSDLKAKQSLLDSIQLAQSSYIASGDLVPILDGLLADLLRLTRSEFGFIAEVYEDAAGAITFGSNVVRNLRNGAATQQSEADTTRLPQELKSLIPFLAEVLKHKQPRFAQEYLKTAMGKERGADKPELRTLMALPITHGNDIIGVVALANRPVGYDLKLADFLQPAVSTCGKLFYACSNERRQRKADLERQKFFFLVEHSSDCIGMATLDGLMFFLNPAGRRMLGLSIDSPINLTCMWDFYFKGGELFFHQKVLPALRKTGRWEGEVQVCNQQTHEPVTVFQNVFLVSSDDQSEPLYLAVANRDISESKKAEHALNQAKEDAEAASRSKSEFLANMSHEVRTPMVAILGFAEMLLDAELSPDERRRAVLNISRNGNHLLQVINDILDLSKIEAGKLMLEFERYSPWQIVVETLSALQVRGEEKRARLTAAPSGQLPKTIMTDPRRVRQILYNLLSNALKFTNADRKVEVTLSMDASGKVLCFDVIDQGIGITESQMGRLFYPFEQGDSSTTRRFGGTGLGLSVSKRLAEMMGGDIIAESTPGEGSRFIFRLPLDLTQDITWVPAEQLELETVVDVAVKQKKTLASFKGRILLAEDSRDSQIVVKYHLQKVGLEVDIAATGKAAVQKAQEKQYDVILMDMQMPEMDGYTATSMLRKMGYTLPIIALTAHAMRGDREKCTRAGCDDYLTKPIDSETLISTILRYLAKRDVERSGANSNPEVGDKSTQMVATDLLSLRKIPNRIPSTYCDDTAMLPLIEEYAGGLRQTVADLHQAIKMGDSSKVATLAHQTKGAGGMYGYPILSEAAGALEAAAKRGAASYELRQYWDVVNVVVQGVQLGLQPVA